MRSASMVLTALLMVSAQNGITQDRRAPAELPPDISGVYQAIANRDTLPGGLRNTGSPSDIVLLPAAEQQRKNVNLSADPEKMCQNIGPFRMMARDRTKIEIAPARSTIVMLFEDISHGNMRQIFMMRGHPEKLTPTWLGDSVGKWMGDTLVVDTIGFNDQTWLNDAGAQHSDALHLVERIRPILGGRFLEYRVTAEDSKSLAKPYTYKRYYERLETDIMEDICEQ